MTEIYQNQYTVLPVATDRFDRLLPSMMLRLSQQISSEHCTILGVDRPFLDPKGLFWAIIRSDLTIFHHPKAGDVLTLRTWPMPTTRTAYPRCVVACNSDGQPVFQVTSLWILMDQATRQMVLPGKSGVEVEGIDPDPTVQLPKALSPIQPQRTQTRPVRFLDLDVNCHMNNARYLDWVFDSLDDRFHQTHSLRRAQLCYLNEATEGQLLTLGTSAPEDRQLQVDISRPDSGRIFSAKLHF